ncbi:AsmA family protein, partial [Salinisphaera orenii]
RGPPAETGGGAEQEAAEIDLSMLEDLRLDGKLSADSLTAANIHVTNADLAVRARDGVLTIEPLTAELYEGNVRVTARVDASRETPRYSLAGNLNGLRFAPLLADVAGTERVDALANMSLDLTTSGRQVAAMKRALDGSLGFDLRDGAFNGFNLADLIAAARSRLGDDDAGEDSAALGDDKRTPFSRFAGQFNVNDGVLAGKDLNLVTRVLNATGAGSYDLADNALDYTVNAQVPEDADGTLERLAGVTVPIRLSGSLLSPDYRLDVAGALKGVAEKRLNEEKSKLSDKVREKIEERTGGDKELGGRLQRGIESLFGGGDEQEGDDSQDESR